MHTRWGPDGRVALRRLGGDFDFHGLALHRGGRGGHVHTNPEGAVLPRRDGGPRGRPGHRVGSARTGLVRGSDHVFRIKIPFHRGRVIVKDPENHQLVRSRGGAG